MIFLPLNPPPEGERMTTNEKKFIIHESHEEEIFRMES